MQIIKRMPIPTYEIECQECGSVIHFRASESHCDKIACPVCGVTVWTMNACKLEGHADPPGEPGPRGVPSKYLARDVVERTIADVINRGGTTGEILTEVHHLDGADIKWAKDQPGPNGFPHWIDVEDSLTPSGGYTCCSACGYSIPWDYHSELAFWKFCPKCGEPMEV